MVTRFLIAFFAASLIACGGGTPPAGDPEPAPKADSAAVTPARTDTITDAAVQQMLQHVGPRALEASARVDTLIVAPELVKLRVGETVEPIAVVGLDPRDRDGNRVADVVPIFWIESGDRVAVLDQAGIRALAPGMAVMLVAPVSESIRADTRTTARIRIQVVP